MLLVVNDRLLEHVWPGFWTGKLSDAAGLFLLGAIIVDVVDRVGARRRRASAALLAVGSAFAVVNIRPTAADLGRDMAAAVLDLLGAVLGWIPLVPADGSRATLVADATDLVVLPVLIVPLLVTSRPRRWAPSPPLQDA